MESEQIITKIYGAYNLLISKERHLFEIDVNERSLTHKFAEYLQIGFPDWNVDCEYNRIGIDKKILEKFKQKIDSDNAEGVTVYPDIIIHNRGTKENLVVIEAKKTSSTAKDIDEDKLKAFKEELGYKFAYKVIFPVKEKFEAIKVSECIIEK